MIDTSAKARYKTLSVDTASLIAPEQPSPSYRTWDTGDTTESTFWGNPRSRPSRWGPVQSLAGTPLPSVHGKVLANLNQLPEAPPAKPTPSPEPRSPLVERNVLFEDPRPTQELQGSFCLKSLEAPRAEPSPSQPSLPTPVTEHRSPLAEQLMRMSARVVLEPTSQEALDMLVTAFKRVASTAHPGLDTVAPMLAMLSALTELIPQPQPAQAPPTLDAAHQPVPSRRRRRAKRVQTTPAPRQCQWSVGQAGAAINPLQCVAISLYEQATAWLVHFTLHRVLVEGELLHSAQQSQEPLLEALLHWVSSSAVAQQCERGGELAERLKQALGSC